MADDRNNGGYGADDSPTDPPQLPPVPDSDVYDADFAGGAAYPNSDGPHDPARHDAGPYPDPASPAAIAEPVAAYARPPGWKYILAFGAIMAGVAVVPVAVILRGLPGLAIGAALAAGLIIPGAWWLMHERREHRAAVDPDAPAGVMDRKWRFVAPLSVVALILGGVLAVALPDPGPDEGATEEETSSHRRPPTPTRTTTSRTTQPTVTETTTPPTTSTTSSSTTTSESTTTSTTSRPTSPTTEPTSPTQTTQPTQTTPPTQTTQPTQPTQPTQTTQPTVDPGPEPPVEPPVM